MIVLDQYLTEVIDKYRIVGKLLIIEDKKIHVGLVNNGFYDIPGGGVKKGESPEEAAIRETLEEIGVKVKNIKPIGKVKRFEFQNPQYFKGQEMYFFIAEFDGIDKSKYGEGPEGKRKHVVVPIEEVIRSREEEIKNRSEDDPDTEWKNERAKFLIDLLNEFL